jgi:methyl-accepting chemotaxis protein
MHWTIGKKLYTCVGVLTGVAALMVAGGQFAQGQLRKSSSELSTRTAPSLRRAIELQYLVEAFRSANRYNIALAARQQGPAIVKNRAKMEQIHAQFNTVAGELEHGTSLPEIQTLSREAVAAMNDFSAKCLEIADLSAAFKTMEAATRIDAAGPLGNKAEEVAARIAEIEDARLKTVEETNASVAREGVLILGGLAAILILGLALVAYVTRGIIGTLTAVVARLKAGSEQVSSAAAQVASSAQSLSQGSTEQAASLEETSASMEEMASMTRRNAANSQQTAQLIAEVDRFVSGSNKALEEMMHSMTAIQESSGKVSKIIKTIDEIAFQTNILALNAAVEAARAGEAGMGFAVVADEVRNLAQRSAQAAKDTASLIEESIGNSQAGHSKMTLVAQSIGSITDSVTKVKGLVDEVSEASQQQAQGIDQVSSAVAQMEKVTQSTAASAEESAAASEELNAQAGTTMAEVTELEAMVVSAPARATTLPRASASASSRFGKLVRMSDRRPAQTPASSATAEDRIPLGDTGTYGSF